MVKNPVLGKVKTRLAADIGNEKALQVYHHLLQHTCSVASDVQADRFVFYSDNIERNDIFKNDVFKKYVQCNGNLGVRMDYAFSIPFKNEYNKVVMIGSDCFELTAAHIQQAFDALQENDFVLGPAHDGGYYLIAMKKWNRWIFLNKNWSTEILYIETLAEIEMKNGKVFQLETLHDIDTNNELQKFDALKNM